MPDAREKPFASTPGASGNEGGEGVVAKVDHVYEVVGGFAKVHDACRGDADVGVPGQALQLSEPVKRRLGVVQLWVVALGRYLYDLQFRSVDVETGAEGFVGAVEVACEIHCHGQVAVLLEGRDERERQLLAAAESEAEAVV